MAAFDFTAELPVGDIQIGKGSHIRIYGFSDLVPPLVEMRLQQGQAEEVLNLTIDQARALSAVLIAAVSKAKAP